MAFCSNCGAEIAEGNKFCPECGAKVMPAFTPSSESDADASAPASDSSTPSQSAPTPSENMFTYTPDTQTGSSYTPSYSYDPSAAAPRTSPEIPGGMQTHKEKRSALVPILLIVLAIAVVGVILLFVLGGNSNSFESVTYNAVSAKYMGTAVDVDTMWPEGFSVELISKNKCIVTVDGESQKCSYDYDKDDGEIEIDLGKDNELEGRIRGDTLYLEDVLDTGVDLTFAREGSDEIANENANIYDETAGNGTGADTIQITSDDYWTGDWYGWWIAYNGTGDYAYLVDYAFDACASITKDKDGSYVLTLWDVDCDRGENISHCSLTLGKGTTENGRLVSEEGYFYNQDFGAGDWVIDPGDSVVSEFDHMICIQGSYVDPEDSSSTMDYYIFLRPWGMSWDDVRSADTTDMPYDDMMPVYYDDWYVSRMNGTMPAYFDIDFDDPD